MKAIVAVTALLLSCTLAQAQNTPLKITPALMKKFQTAISPHLKDPDSARYRGVVAVKTSTGFHAFCGFINAKNSYGGYTGEKLFNAGFTNTEADIAISDGTSFVDRGFMQWCAKYGLSPG